MSIALRTYFILIFTVFIILFTAVIGFIISKESGKSVEQQISESLTEKAFQMAERLDQFMWSRYGEVTVLSHLKAFEQTDNTEEIGKILNELKANFPSFSWIGYTNAEGVVKASTDQVLLGADISHRPVFTEAQTEPFIGDVHEAVLLAELLPNPSGEPLKFVDISSPIFTDDHEFVGVLAAHLSFEWADEVKRSVIQPLKEQGENLDVFIISKQDNTVLLGPSDMIGQALHLQAIELAQQGRNDWTVEKWPDGKSYLTGYAFAEGFLNYPGLDWTILVRQPQDVAFLSVTQLRNKIVLVGALLAVAFAVISWYVAGLVSNPLRELVATAQQLRNGEKVEIYVKKGIKDIETLSTAYRDLIATLTRTKSDLGKMETIAQIDKLTELPNRLALDNYMDALHQSDRAINHAILYLDLDGFKAVNDQYGHHHGDLLLKEVAERLKRSLGMMK